QLDRDAAGHRRLRLDRGRGQGGGGRRRGQGEDHAGMGAAGRRPRGHGRGHDHDHARGAPAARGEGRMKRRPKTTATRRPPFYDRLAVGTLYLERAALVTEAALAARARQGGPDAHADRERIAAFGIDCQVAFCTPGASLFVPGAVEDTVRAIEWLYRNLP